ncbi:hypothetical protein [Streptomyces minutiscleroticus]|uniref:Uncharacterized protein n=1 Tax=Streptomyces minutiscleroticus TaxID=68238 RepID=A0A918U6L3_9ACTN|nr:hypothetical protein [Streptomyces minutiscleroticus]GGY03343.1 hypothetical protein GCM10010358_66340 [Streptomyces minutiscleroticus]
MGGRQVLAVRRSLAEALDGELPEHERLAVARSLVGELGAPGRLLELVADLASGEGDPEACARLSYRHVLGFDKLLLVDAGSRHMLRAHLWHPGGGAAGGEDVHNHRSPLASCVVRGRLTMELYASGDGGGAPAERYRESLAGRSADWLLEPAGAASLRLAQVAEYTAGSTYALPAHTLHRARTEAPGPTVTLFLETGRGRRRHTDVFTAGPHPEAVPKVPLSVRDYLAELAALAELLRAS